MRIKKVPRVVKHRAPIRISAIDADEEILAEARRLDEEARLRAAAEKGLDETSKLKGSEQFIWLMDKAAELINGAEARIDFTAFCEDVRQAWAALAAVRRHLKRADPKLYPYQKKFKSLRERAQRMMGVCPRKE